MRLPKAREWENKPPITLGVEDWVTYTLLFHPERNCRPSSFGYHGSSCSSNLQPRNKGNNHRENGKKEPSPIHLSSSLLAFLACHLALIASFNISERLSSSTPSPPSSRSSSPAVALTLAPATPVVLPACCCDSLPYKRMSDSSCCCAVRPRGNGVRDCIPSAPMSSAMPVPVKGGINEGRPAVGDSCWF